MLIDPVFANRVALVTGGSRGIGRAIAYRLAQQGASVVVNFVKREDKAAEVVELIRGLGGNALTMCADVSRYTEVEAMITQVVDEVGHIDFLINNAGINLDRSIIKMDLDWWQRVIDVNLTGTFNCCRCVLRNPPKLKLEPSSRIINISSVIGQMGSFGQTNYAAAKAGSIGLTKSLARELAKYGVTVNTIAPGFIETDMVNAMPKQVLGAILRQIPLQRIGQPSEIAEVVAFLCSAQAGYITGSVINVNGGLYM